MRKKEKSFFFDVEDYTLALILWIITLLAVFIDIGGAVMIFSVVCLLFERNFYVRNHASQVLVIGSLCFMWDIIFSIVSGTFRFTLGWIPLINIATNSGLWIMNMFVSVILVFFVIYGLVKAIQNNFVHLPFLNPIGEALEKNIHPLKK